MSGTADAVRVAELESECAELREGLGWALDVLEVLGCVQNWENALYEARSHHLTNDVEVLSKRLDAFNRFRVLLTGGVD